jgi:hypothetical protein
VDETLQVVRDQSAGFGTGPIEEAVRAAADPIEVLGANYMLHPETFARTIENGYPHPFAGYFAGRGGVLGDVPTEIIDAIFYVFEPSVAKLFWEQGQAVHGAKKGAELYFEQIHLWARDHLADAPNLERLAELGEKIIQSTPASGLPLFAGWKAMPLPEDAPARALQVIMTLRELRGAVHLAVVTAAGLTPVEGHLLNKGPEYCAFFGWPGPFPSVDHLKETREQVEETTNDRVTAIWAAALTPAEAAELAHLASAALAASAG